jgi:hypothetical protein
MKFRFYLLLIIGFVLFSCSEEEQLRTFTVLFEADGTGNVEYLVHTINCGDNLTFCAKQAIFENQTLPFSAEVENYYSELIYIKIVIADDAQKDNLSELRITIDDKVQVLKREDFYWWDDSPNGIELEFSVSAE